MGQYRADSGRQALPNGMQFAPALVTSEGRFPIGLSSGTDTVSTLHRRPAAAYRTTQPSSAPVRRRHADLWLLLSVGSVAAAGADIDVRRRRRTVDAV